MGGGIVCTHCGRDLPKCEYHKRRSASSGIRQPCKQCTGRKNKNYRERPENKARKREVSRAYYRRPEVRRRVLEKSRQRRRRDHLKYKFGLTPKDITRIRSEQDDRCAICRLRFTKTPNVDHNHSTGVVRGLLCSECNLGLGLFKDSMATMSSAIEYLRMHSRV